MYSTDDRIGVEFEKYMALPVHLEFAVISNGKAEVDFHGANKRDFEVGKYEVY